MQRSMFFSKHSTDANVHTYAHTLVSMNARTRTCPYEHLGKTEPAYHLNIDEVTTCSSVVDGTYAPTERTLSKKLK